MLMLILIPAIMSTIGVVREKETVDRQFLFDADHQARVPVRQATALYRGLDDQFRILAGPLGFPVRGAGQRILAALMLGTLFYVAATTGFGQLVSTFTQTQVAAVFATVVIFAYSGSELLGLLVPVSSLSGAGRLAGLGFPSSWYQPVSVGAFTKGLGFEELWPNLLVLAAFFAVRNRGDADPAEAGGLTCSRTIIPRPCKNQTRKRGCSLTLRISIVWRLKSSEVSGPIP